jgi:hypothetical protein
VSEGAPCATPTIGLFHATSRDGKSFSARVRVPTEGLPHHPQLSIGSNGSLALVWDELTGGKRRVVLAQGAAKADGSVSFSRQILSGGEPAVYPVVAAVPEGVVTAWTSSSTESSVIRIDRRTTSGKRTSTSQ